MEIIIPNQYIIKRKMYNEEKQLLNSLKHDPIALKNILREFVSDLYEANNDFDFTVSNTAVFFKKLRPYKQREYYYKNHKVRINKIDFSALTLEEINEIIAPKFLLTDGRLTINNWFSNHRFVRFERSKRKHNITQLINLSRSDYICNNTSKLNDLLTYIRDNRVEYIQNDFREEQYDLMNHFGVIHFGGKYCRTCYKPTAEIKEYFCRTPFYASTR